MHILRALRILQVLREYAVSHVYTAPCRKVACGVNHEAIVPSRVAKALVPGQTRYHEDLQSLVIHLKPVSVMCQVRNTWALSVVVVLHCEFWVKIGKWVYGRAVPP